MFPFSVSEMSWTVRETWMIISGPVCRCADVQSRNTAMEMFCSTVCLQLYWMNGPVASCAVCVLCVFSDNSQCVCALVGQVGPSVALADKGVLFQQQQQQLSAVWLPLQVRLTLYMFTLVSGCISLPFRLIKWRQTAEKPVVKWVIGCILIQRN